MIVERGAEFANRTKIAWFMLPRGEQFMIGHKREELISAKAIVGRKLRKCVPIIFLIWCAPLRLRM